MEDKNRKTQSEDAVAPFTEEESNALKVLRGTGEENTNPHESAIGGKKISRIEDFWYRHKWKAGLIFGAVIIFVVVLIQIITRSTPDVYIMYTGPQAILAARYDNLEAAFTDVMDDYNGDGEKAINFTDNMFISKEQAEERKKLDADYTYDIQANNAAYQRHAVEIAAGKHAFIMLDPALYEKLASADAFEPLSEIFHGEIPEGAVGEYGIRLGSTEFYLSNEKIRYMPPETVLCIRKSEALDFKDEEKREAYTEMHAQLLRDIVSYVDDNDK